MVKYCPAGDGPVEDWVGQCPVCGRNLVPNPPAGTDNREPPALVKLTTAGNEPEAQMWADTLRSAGVPVFVRAGGPGFGAWGSVASFEHDLFVRTSDLVQARRIYATLLSNRSGALRLVPRRRSPPRVNPARRRSSLPD